MTRPELPADLRRFILTSIASVPHLEAVLLLRAEPARTWTPAEAARRLYLPEPRAAELMRDLAAAGLAAEAEGAYRHEPATPQLRELLDRLAAHYAADIVGVSDLIHSRTDKKAQQFADAFRLRKDS